MAAYDEILARTLDDGRLSRSEREALSQVLAAAEPHEFALVRSRAFELAAGALGPRRARATLAWCEDVVHLLAARELERRSAARSSAGRAEALFSPGDDCVRRIVELARGTRRSLEVCVFTITDDRIREALLDAHERRVAVRIVTDGDKAHDLGSDVARLAERGIPVRVDEGESHMHHKFAVFDAALLLTGSYNWTRSAAEHNEENVVVLDDARLIAAFRREFEALWERFA